MRTNNFTYNLQKRETKTKGVVYDVYFYYTDADGKQVQKKLSGFKTKADATRAYSAFMEQALTRPVVKKEKAKILFYEDARRLYLQAIAPSIKESSLYEITHNAIKYHDVYFHKKNLIIMTKQDVIGFQDWMQTRKKDDGSPLSPRYVAKVYAQFTRFYNWCVQRYEVPDVVKSLPFTTRKVQRRDYTIWTQDDFKRFIAIEDKPKYKALFTTLFYGGMRIGEAQALKVKDYNGTSLFIHATYTRKTLDGTTHKITETKNYKSRRVPLPAPCRAVLDEFVKNRSGDEFLFGGAAPASRNPINRHFQIKIKEAGVPRIRIHDLRHSYVSMLLSLGCSLPAVASLIGDTIEQVVKTYAHSIEDEKITVINSII